MSVTTPIWISTTIFWYRCIAIKVWRCWWCQTPSEYCTNRPPTVFSLPIYKLMIEWRGGCGGRDQCVVDGHELRCSIPLRLQIQSYRTTQPDCSRRSHRIYIYIYLFTFTFTLTVIGHLWSHFIRLVASDRCKPFFLKPLVEGTITGLLPFSLEWTSSSTMWINHQPSHTRIPLEQSKDAMIEMLLCWG